MNDSVALEALLVEAFRRTFHCQQKTVRTSAPFGWRAIIANEPRTAVLVQVGAEPVPCLGEGHAASMAVLVPALSLVSCALQVFAGGRARLVQVECKQGAYFLLRLDASTFGVLIQLPPEPPEQYPAPPLRRA